MSNEVKESPLISVITVVFNRKNDLYETLQNIISQNHHSYEIIVIDGGSTDGTLDIINKYQDHISYWVSEPDKGIYDAMNKGIAAASGEWLNFMNAGDSYASNEIFNNIFYKNNHNANYDLVIGNTDINYGNFTRNQPVGDLINIWKGAQFIHQSVFIKRSFQLSNLYNITNKISGDFEFFYNSYKSNANIIFTPYVVSIFRAHGVSDTKRVSAVFSNMMVVLGAEGFSLKILTFYFISMIKQIITLIVKKILPNSLITRIQLKIYDRK
tara:strand:- start:8388 stop:9194 length:807 start_codon:yes stop_codon:yes gene_type:complete